MQKEAQKNDKKYPNKCKNYFFQKKFNILEKREVK